MRSDRSDILDWSDQGRIPHERLRTALELAGVLPSAADWRKFLDRMLLWLGVVMLAAGTVFFFAFNWDEMGRLAKIGLVEALLAAALVSLWRLGLERASGKAALFGASIVAGTLFALIGQIYQSGADTYELFAVWAIAILPWALVGRLPVLWVLWLALVNLALSLYFLTFGVFWGMLFAPQKLIWLLFGLNTLALTAWEGLAAGGIEWLRERWSVRILATASDGLITALALQDLLDWRDASQWGLPVWFIWAVAAYLAYRRRVKDVYVLAVGMLSAIVLAASFLVKHLRPNDAGAFLLIGLLVIGLSAAGGYWLKRVAAEDQQ